MNKSTQKSRSKIKPSKITTGDIIIILCFIFLVYKGIEELIKQDVLMPVMILLIVIVLIVLLPVFLIRMLRRSRNKRKENALNSKSHETPDTYAAVLLAEEKQLEIAPETEKEQPKAAPVTDNDKVPANLSLLARALELIVYTQNASTAFLQRKFRLGFPLAIRLMDELELRGYIGPQIGSMPRKIYVTNEQLPQAINDIMVLTPSELEADQPETAPVTDSDKVPSDLSVLSLMLMAIVEYHTTSPAMLQRKLKLGAPRAYRLLDDLEQLGYIGPIIGGMPREIYVTEEQLPQIIREIEGNPNTEDLPYHNQYTDDLHYMYVENNSILDTIDAMSNHGLDFELFTVKLLLANGFEEAYATQGSGDYGIDVIAKKDGVSYAIQCKCYSSTVGNKAVQEAFSGKAYYNCMVAVVFTNNYFTKAAQETAKATNVLLWDRKKLIELLANYTPNT